MFKANPTITKNFILNYIPQEEIMEYYLGVSTDSGTFCSPLRNDKHPTCMFSWYRGILYFRDWTHDRPMDCFNVVEHIYNVNFYEALKIIAKDFNLIRNVETGKRERIHNPIDTTKTEEGKSVIRVKVQPLTKGNIAYLKSYHLTSNITNKYNVFSPKYVWINDKLHYVYRHDNPALAYYFGIDEFGNEKWKIYFYKRREGPRFITNTNRINGWIQIPNKADDLIITKSLKDVMCFDIFDIPSIAMQAESQTPYDYIIDELKERFNNIVTLFDHDDTGIKRAKTIKELYDIPYYFIKSGEAKDFSDYIKLFGPVKAGELITKILYERNSNN